MNRLVLSCALLGFSSITHLAHAESADGTWDGDYKQVARRRSGFVASIGLGLALGEASGYPNEIAKLGDPAYKRNTGVAFGGADHLWLGGALTDYLVVGLGFVITGIKHDQTTAGGSAFVFHVQGYPLFYRGSAFQDLSLFADFGAGGMKITGNDRPDADGGLMSVLGLGAGYEPVRFWRFTFGPTVEYWHWWSQTLTMNSVAVEAKLTLVAGP
ncbi:MAG TPA: hypothetical protein VFK05_20620 [Polyangiaceae bacterium]|nr:hypothetical protein [Polyangiaceae bacterium]